LNINPVFSDNLMGDEDYILIHKLELSKITTKGLFSILPAPRQSNSQTDDMVIDVASQEKGNPAVLFTTPVKVKNHESGVSLFASSDAIIMHPQAFPADSDAKIILSFSINDEQTIRQGVFPLNNQTWESGNSYTYKFTIERSGLKLDKCEISPWNEIKGGDITVD
ncbi:MAG: fimbrillin family protein, partial [Duncaniella sp.]|nr:fimbrillin family protein [Duncaniella sp.]